MYNKLKNNSSPPTIIIRHRRENLKKCSLLGLEKREDFYFLNYPNCILPNLEATIFLSMDGEPLTSQDKDFGLLLLDGTWRYEKKMKSVLKLDLHPRKRSLPSWVKSAYPRRQDDCEDPSRGLATIEALWIAYFILERERDGLLDNYYWKESFLKMNYEKTGTLN